MTLWEFVHITKYIIAATAPLPRSVDRAATRTVDIFPPRSEPV